jgi:UDP-sulfoquinovose synthase
MVKAAGRARPQEDSSTILVLGGDGYIGWPLSLHLARKHPCRRVLSVDNLLRRRLVEEVGAESLVPIGSPAERGAAARAVGISNLEIVVLDATTTELTHLVGRERPGLIYHLAQQCSAPYSMRDVEASLMTLANNESSNLRLLWAVRDLVPAAHVIKMGSFGEYAKGGLDIAEGYFQPQYRGRSAMRPLPYPREADDFYHATKINDSNLISVACRKWGLKVTDVMQSTIFGAQTEESKAEQGLSTRFDYDECFGTVLNRFLVQAMVGQPLLVYGTGHQRTGLMALPDCIRLMGALADHPPAPGEHHVVNHVTETSYSINELAARVSTVLAERGCTTRIAHSYDPRQEQPAAKMSYAIESSALTDGSQITPLELVLHSTLDAIQGLSSRVRLRCLPPVTAWARGAVVDASTPAEATDEWERVRSEQFPWRVLDLNPGSLAQPSLAVQRVTATEVAGEQCSHLDRYARARLVAKGIAERAGGLWPLPGLDLVVTNGATQCANLMALSLAHRAAPRRPCTVLTTRHEHAGALGAFQRHPAFAVSYLPDDALRDPRRVAQAVGAARPTILLLSHVTFDLAWVLPVSEMASGVRQASPDTLIVVDAAQSLGLHPLPAGDYDAVFASTHKWLFGPEGGGLLWTSARFRSACVALDWTGCGLLEDGSLKPFGLAGGHCLSLYPAIEEALRVYEDIGPDRIRARSAWLRAAGEPDIVAAFRKRQVPVEVLSPPDSPVLALGFPEHHPYELYQRLNRQGVHLKFIRDVPLGARSYDVLRIGFPYFESLGRLEKATQAIATWVGDECPLRPARPASVLESASIEISP